VGWGFHYWLIGEAVFRLHLAAHAAQATGASVPNAEPAMATWCAGVYDVPE
jgi:hypothetical protein